MEHTHGDTARQKLSRYPKRTPPIRCISFSVLLFFRVCAADDTLVWLRSGQITRIQQRGLPCVFSLDGEIITVFQKSKCCQVVIVFTSASKQSVIRAPVNQPK